MTSNIFIAGCGALGSHIAMGICSPERKLYLVDHDKVEQQNIATSVYGTIDLGTPKVNALAGLIWNKCGAIPEFKNRRVTNANQLLGWVRGSVKFDVGIDTFDNAEARNLTIGLAIPMVHVGVSMQGLGSVEWDETFQPIRESGDEANEVCTHEAGRDLISLTASVACVIINRFLETGKKRSAYVDVNGIEVYH